MKEDRKKALFLGIGIGLIAGVLLMLCVEKVRLLKERGDKDVTVLTEEDKGRQSEEIKKEASGNSETKATAKVKEWDRDTVYTGGERILYENRIYRAKWWTQGEKPGQADVWEDTLETPANLIEKAEDDKQAGKETDYTESAGLKKEQTEEFKIIGYYPSWKPEETDKIRYDVLTHVIYAFAIPTTEGKLRPLDNGETAENIIKQAHAAGCKVLIAVGGWSYNDAVLEPVFMEATATKQKRGSLVNEIVALCEEYGFDGVDMDWEHPRVDGTSAARYEEVMLALGEKLHKQNRILTCAVISGATADGEIYYDAAAHSDKVLDMVDWIHVMAYDGGDGERHSSYEFAVRSAKYWKETRGLSAEKVMLGVPFYSRPGWATYEEILSWNTSAWKIDHSDYHGMEVWYNGIDTIQKKTKYACDNLGGVMIWEITQDTSDTEKSLITAIKEASEDR